MILPCLDWVLLANKKMNKLTLVLYPLLFCGLLSCNGMTKSNGAIEAVGKTDSCKLDRKNTYQIYIPKRANSAEKLPLLVIIDAHGNGKFALNKFKLGAEKYPAVIVASDYVKNGFEGFENAIQTLVDDVNQKYPTNKTLFLTGFSGGARMALSYAMSHQTDGLILCGALASAEQLNSLHCPVFSISGMDDFNFLETAQYLFREQSIPQNLKIELTNASHSWPDSLMLANAFGFLRLTSQKEKASTVSKSLLTDYSKQQLARMGFLQKQGDFLKATLIARNMAVTEPFSNDRVFATTYSELKNNAVYLNQLDHLGKCLNLEMQVRQSYLDAFQTKDTQWWRNEIQKFDETIANEKDAYTKDTYKRIRGFLGIVSYTFCKQAVGEHNVEMLEKVLSVYRTLEPENSDMFYFSSFPYLWKGENDKTIELLNKARKAGFSDINQLKKDFPAFITSGLTN